MCQYSFMTTEDFPLRGTNTTEAITDVFSPEEGEHLTPNTVDQVARRLALAYVGSRPAIDIALGLFGQGATSEEVFDVLTNIEDSYLNPPRSDAG